VRVSGSYPCLANHHVRLDACPTAGWHPAHPLQQDPRRPAAMVAVQEYAGGEHHLQSMPGARSVLEQVRWVMCRCLPACYDLQQKLCMVQLPLQQQVDSG
jgi:hypothetical protein